MIPREVIQKIRHIEIHTRHLVNDVFAGQYHSVFKGQGIEFEEVREYVPGDDIRSIDWNVTARMGHPYVKKFVEERERTLLLLVDISASHRFGSHRQLKRDLAAEIAATLAFSAIRNNDRVGLILFTDQVERYVPPNKGPRHVLRVIREVLYAQPRHKATRVQPALDFMNQVTRRGSIAFLISDFYFHEPFEKPLRITGRRHDLISVLIGDRREQEWPAAGLIEWEDAESGRRLLLDASDRRTRRALARAEGERRDTLRRTLRRWGIDSIDVHTGEPFDKALIQFFRMREGRL